MVEYCLCGTIPQSHATFGTDLSAQAVRTAGSTPTALLFALTNPSARLHSALFRLTVESRPRLARSAHSHPRRSLLEAQYPAAPVDASLNTSELENAERLAMLVLSPALGAVVREAAPLKR